MNMGHETAGIAMSQDVPKSYLDSYAHFADVGNAGLEKSAGISLRWVKDMTTELAFPKQLISGFYEAKGIGAIYGPPNSGKSTFAIDQAISIAGGLQWNGTSVHGGIVCIIAAESPEGTEWRIRAKIKVLGLDVSAIHLAVHKGPLSFDQDSISMLVDTLKSESYQRRVPVRLVLIDTLASNAPGKEDAEHFGHVIQALSRIRDELDCFALVVHHSGKQIDAGLRGHSSLLGALDTVIEISVDGQGRTATIVKQRDGLTGQRFAFKLNPISIGFRETDAEGFPETVTACVIEHQGFREPNRPQPKDGHQTRALDALNKAAKDMGQRRWAMKEAVAIIVEYHGSVASDSRRMSRNTPRNTLHALANKGLVILTEGNHFVSLPEAE
jgi:KaiC/GvpD/RAD55 family RecA-like ATPase